MRSIVSLTARSLPGIGVAEKTTVSPECSSTSRWSLLAIRRSAESGSPWLPVEIDDDLLVGEVLDLPRLDEEPRRRLGDPEVRGDVEVLAHRAADQRHPAVELHGGVDHLLDAVDVGGEGGDDDPALAAGEGLQQRRADARLRGRDPRPVGVGRVAAEQQQAVAAELGEPRDVGGAAVDRGLVELVVAGHQHRAELGRRAAPRACRGSSARGGSARARTGPAWTFSPAGSSSSGASSSLCSSSFERTMPIVSRPP